MRCVASNALSSIAGYCHRRGRFNFSALRSRSNGKISLKTVIELTTMPQMIG